MKVRLMNKISQEGLKRLPADRYEVGEDMEHADAIMVRSASLHEMTFEPELKCIARAGAGVNNIPLERYNYPLGLIYQLVGLFQQLLGALFFPRSDHSHTFERGQLLFQISQHRLLALCGCFLLGIFAACSLELSQLLI